jgi:lysozyme
MSRAGWVVVSIGLAAGCAPPPPEIAAESEGVMACPGPDVVEGLDVSEYQKTIDWTQVKQSGRGFAITRVSDGTGHPDPTFGTNYLGIKNAGMVRGSYQYFRAHLDPIAQADLLLSKVSPLTDGDLPPALDMETLDGQTVAVTVQKMDAWLKYVEQKTGRPPMIYSSPSFWTSLGNPDYSRNVLWIAHWMTACPNTPTTWTGWKVWQYSSTGNTTVATKVPGLGTGVAVDLDRFNGTAAALAQLATWPRGDGGSGAPLDGGGSGAPLDGGGGTSSDDGGGAALADGSGAVAHDGGVGPRTGAAPDGGCALAGRAASGRSLLLVAAAALLARRRRRAA